MKKRALLTGGAGFVGSHLAEALLDAGHSVEVIDDLSTGSLDNIAHLADRPGFRHTTDTVMNRDLVSEMVSRADVVFHLAAAVGVKLIVEAPVRTIETNVHGTEVVLQEARRRGTQVVIFSTSEVYGKSTNVPFSETSDLVMGPTSKHRWAYACSKALDEFLALAYFREYGLPVVIVRLFNTVGPRQTGRYGMVIPRFVTQALAGDPITVYGDGTQSRAFTYVGDVVTGLLGLMDASDVNGEIYNIGNSEEISMLALAEKVKAMTGSSSDIVLVPYDQAYEAGFEDMPRRVPDLRKIRDAVGYVPTVGLDEILQRVIAHTSAGMASRP